MSADSPSELESYRQFLDHQIAAGQTDVSPEQSVRMWRELDVEAIREALADLEAGDRGKSLKEFRRDFREKHGLPERK